MKKATLFFILAIITSAGLNLKYHNNVNAEYLGGRYPHTTGQTTYIKWYYYNNHTYLGNVWQGAQNWHVSTRLVEFSRVDYDDENIGTNLVIKDRWSSENYWGITYYPSGNSTYYYNTILMNTRTLSNENDFTRTKVATHEFGHALGLDHTPSNGPDSVMKQGHQWYNTPMPYDENNINNLYN